MKMAIKKGSSLSRVTSTSVLMLGFALLLSGCVTERAPLPPPPPPAPAGPPVALSSNVSDAAAVYVDYVTTARTMNASFADAEAVQVKLQEGASFQPDQLSRGVVAYAAIVAMQETSFRAALRAYAADDTARAELVHRLTNDVTYASTLPSADIAARRVILALSSDGQSVYNSGAGVKRAAYDVQRQKWSREKIADRDGRLIQAKQNSVALRSVQSDESARLLAAALNGSGLTTQATTGQSTGGYVIQGDGVTLSPDTASPTSDDQSALATAPATRLAAAPAAGDAAIPASTFASTTDLFDRADLFNQPYTGTVNRALTIAALAILGEGGDNRANYMSELMNEADGERCLDMSKLNLYQCLAVSTPHFEDVFCLGQHVLMDTGQCLGKMSSNALSFEPAKVASLYADAEPYFKPAAVKKASVKKTGKKKASSGKRKKRR
ncbi:hypothetical protein [Asticcacaulis sp. AC402]|uniref:hypothetical protein n=1 Tax=Asticcacaulis sp. AC402 TaxID=1282361 RepID=UPI0003C3AF6F|nr:hypothetical protein [Asticcacaulis sp. AC402]ESQ74750.1 hypothetical protein ABAC402_12655 [Asticcacaulis sp. AC402]